MEYTNNLGIANKDGVELAQRPPVTPSQASERSVPYPQYFINLTGDGQTEPPSKVAKLSDRHLSNGASPKISSGNDEGRLELHTNAKFELPNRNANALVSNFQKQSTQTSTSHSENGTEKISPQSIVSPTYLHSCLPNAKGRYVRANADPAVSEQPRGKKPRGRPRIHRPAPERNETEHKSSHIKVEVPWRPLPHQWREKHKDSPFIQQLEKMEPKVYIRNDVDKSGPPSNFEFIKANLFCEGTFAPDPEATLGCDCKSDMNHVGCELRSCSCLEDVATKEDGTPVGFPYHAKGDKKGCLRGIYLNERHAIYECNDLCACPAYCKNKVVSRGRKIRLEIFKTDKRGWGLRSPDDIQKGQFIDTYRGEIITNEEADRREDAARAASEKTTIQGTEVDNFSKDSYLFELDKFAEYIQEGEAYVVDGQYKGGPTRFLNHSCNPNLRQFTVSFSRGNPKIYDLAFFAREDIPKFTELTFDYHDLDEPDEDLDEKGLENAQREKGIRATNCQCGEENCRGYLW